MVGENYWVVYLLENCDGVSKWENVVVSLKDLTSNIFRIYPNPAKDAVNVETDGKTGYFVELVNQHGSVLYKSKIEGTLHRINLSNLSNGVYFVTVKSDNYNHTQRIMKL